MTPERLRFNLVIGTLFIASAFLLGFDPVLSKLGMVYQTSVVQPVDISNQQSLEDPQKLIQGRPVTVYLPDVELQRTIIDGDYNPDNRSWTLSGQYAHFATISMLPNNKTGNTFIYGHNTPAVFAGLKNLRAGNTAFIRVDSGETFVYRYIKSTEVYPEDVSILGQTIKPTLSLQTCTGLWYQKRTVYQFEFVEVLS